MEDRVNGIIERIQETIAYFDDEFSKEIKDDVKKLYAHLGVWKQPLCQHAGGVTANDLLDILQAREEAAAQFRKLGALIPLNNGDGVLRSFENDPSDAIIDAVKRRLKSFEEALNSSLQTNHALCRKLEEARVLVEELVLLITPNKHGDGTKVYNADNIEKALTKASKWIEGK